MVALEPRFNFHDLVDLENGTIDRRLFSDTALYELELERIFARGWSFMCHASQIPNPGDFFMTFIGEDRVICVRDNEGNPQVLVNSCRHRGNAVCRAEEGHSSSFMCTYHGWTYDLQGRLVGVPGFKEVYHAELDREGWGLIRAPHVDTYKGFVFASLDPDAPALLDYLGETGQIGVSMMAERGEDVAVLGGVQKYTVNCNWKFAVDNVFDYYHVELTHSSALLVREVKRPSLMGAPQRTILGHYGHAIGGPGYNAASGSLPWRNRPEAQTALGPVGMGSNGHPHIFPNTWIATTTNQIIVRHPKGPAKTEVWLYTVLDREMSTDRYAQQRDYAIHIHGPAGSFEMEDGENWDQSTAGMRGHSSRRSPLHYGLNLGRGEVVQDEAGPAYIDSKFAEHPQLWVWKSWCHWMSTSTWEELRIATAAPPSVM